MWINHRSDQEIFSASRSSRPFPKFSINRLRPTDSVTASPNSDVRVHTPLPVGTWRQTGTHRRPLSITLPSSTWGGRSTHECL